MECVAEDLELTAAGKTGFLFRRGVIPRERVQAARQLILDAMKEDEAVSLLTRQDVAFKIRNVLECQEVVSMVQQWTGLQDVKVFPYKWLRAVRPGLCTGFHVDETYLNKIFDCNFRVVSAWIPLGTIDSTLGSLLICKDENLNDRLRKRCLEKELGQDGTSSGWISVENELLQDAQNWATAFFEPGDVLIFNPDVVHCTMVNTTDEVRLSCDVRFLCKK